LSSDEALTYALNELEGRTDTGPPYDYHEDHAIELDLEQREIRDLPHEDPNWDHIMGDFTVKPGIWSLEEDSKISRNLTLSKSAVGLFEDLRSRLGELFRRKERGQEDPSDSWWDVNFGRIPPPKDRERISQSLITEIALWNLFHSTGGGSGVFAPLAKPSGSPQPVTGSEILGDEAFLQQLKALVNETIDIRKE
jgi:hypothetical protein